MSESIKIRRSDFSFALDVMVRVGERQSSRARRLRRRAAQYVNRVLLKKADEAALIQMIYGGVAIEYEKDAEELRP